MPTQIYNSGWKSPTSISLYNGGWNTVKVGYVYDTGVWRVVYPDPITPSIALRTGPVGDRYYVWAEFTAINCDYIEAYLYSGTTQTNLVASQTIDVNENNSVNYPIASFYNLQNNTTYNMKIIAYSITGNSVTLLTGPATTINVIIPTVSITGVSVNPYLTSATINWNSTNQNYYGWEIRKNGVYQDGQLTVYSSTDRSVVSNINLIPSTTYSATVFVYSSSGDSATSVQNFTTPSSAAPSYSNFAITSTTCNSMTVSWNAINYTSGTIEIWTTGPTPSRIPKKITKVAFKDFTSLSSWTFTGLTDSTDYGFTLILNGTITTNSDITDGFGNICPEVYGSTSTAGVGPINNFTATSNTYGDAVTLNWQTPVVNCSTLSGYNIEYKLTSSSTWTTATTSLGASAVSYPTGSILTANTAYDFRITAKSAAGNSQATTSLTTNNTAYSFSILPATSSTTTYNSFNTTVQLKNISGGNVSQSGKSFTFGTSQTGRGSFSTNPVSTNASGNATATFNTNETTGTLNITASTTGLGVNSATSGNISVSLSSGLTTNLTSTRTASGYSCSQTYNSLYTYIGYAGAGSSLASGSYASSSFTMSIPIADAGVRPIATANLTAKTLSCNVNNSWTIQPSATTSVYTSRTGYTTVLNQTTNSPNRTASYAFLWQYSTSGSNGPWTDWQAVQSFTYSSAITNTRWCRCRVTVTGSDGDTAGGNNVKFSDTVTIP